MMSSIADQRAALLEKARATRQLETEAAALVADVLQSGSLTHVRVGKLTVAREQNPALFAIAVAKMKPRLEEKVRNPDANPFEHIDNLPELVIALRNAMVLPENFLAFDISDPNAASTAALVQLTVIDVLRKQVPVAERVALLTGLRDTHGLLAFTHAIERIKKELADPQQGASVNQYAELLRTLQREGLVPQDFLAVDVDLSEPPSVAAAPEASLRAQPLPRVTGPIGDSDPGIRLDDLLGSLGGTTHEEPTSSASPFTAGPAGADDEEEPVELGSGLIELGDDDGIEPADEESPVVGGVFLEPDAEVDVEVPDDLIESEVVIEPVGRVAIPIAEPEPEQAAQKTEILRARIQEILDRYAPYLPAQDGDGTATFTIVFESGNPPQIFRNGKSSDSLGLDDARSMLDLFTDLRIFFTREQVASFSGDFTVNPVSQGIKMVLAQTTLNHVAFVLQDIHSTITRRVMEELRTTHDATISERFGHNWQEQLKKIKPLDPAAAAPKPRGGALVRLQNVYPTVNSQSDAIAFIRSITPFLPVGTVTVAVTDTQVEFRTHDGREIDSNGRQQKLHAANERPALGDHYVELVGSLKRYLHTVCKEFPVRVERIDVMSAAERLQPGSADADHLVGLFLTMPREVQLAVKDLSGKSSPAYLRLRSELSRAFEQAEADRRMEETPDYSQTAGAGTTLHRVAPPTVLQRPTGALPPEVVGPVLAGFAQLADASLVPPSRVFIVAGILELLKPAAEQNNQIIIHALDAIERLGTRENNYYATHTPDITPNETEALPDLLKRTLADSKDVKAGPEDAAWEYFITQLKDAARARGIVPTRTEHSPLPALQGSASSNSGPRRLTT